MREIRLSQDKVALVDDSDFEWLNQWKWCALKIRIGFYAVRSDNRKMSYMHRVILDAPKGVLCDHRDRDGLNNQRSNLRLATHAQNQANRRARIDSTANYKGISFEARSGRWVARVQRHYIGAFVEAVDAARAYDSEALRVYGEFALINFPKEK